MFSFLAELETMEEFEPPKLWKRHGVLLAIRAHRTSKEISEFFNISLRMVQTVGRELEDSGFDYEATAKRKRHDRRSDAVRTPEFVARPWSSVSSAVKVTSCHPTSSLRA